MKGKIFAIQANSRDVDGFWNFTETHLICLGGQIHVKYLRERGTRIEVEEESTEVIGLCDGSCHKSTELSSKIEAEVHLYLRHNTLPDHGCVKQESEDVFLIQLPDGCTPGRDEALKFFIEAIAWLKLMRNNSRFSTAPFAHNEDGVTAWVATRI